MSKIPTSSILVLVRTTLARVGPDQLMIFADPENPQTRTLERSLNQHNAQCHSITSLFSSEMGNSLSPRRLLQAFVAAIKSSQPCSKKPHLLTNGSESSQLPACSGKLHTTTPPLCQLPFSSSSAPLARTLCENTAAFIWLVAIARIILKRRRACGSMSMMGSCGNWYCSSTGVRDAGTWRSAIRGVAIAAPVCRAVKSTPRCCAFVTAPDMKLRLIS